MLSISLNTTDLRPVATKLLRFVEQAKVAIKWTEFPA